MTPSQEQAEVRAAKREPVAFAPLYERYVDAIYGFCLRRLGDPDLAADATAEVFVKALATLGTFRGDSFRSWIFTIARNTVIDRYRARKPVDQLPETLISQQPEPEVVALQRETRTELRVALTQLTEQQQDVISLRLSGLTGKEIAAAMNISHGAVKATQIRAFARLRDLMASPTDLLQEDNRD